MSWDYRVVHHHIEWNSGEDFYKIHKAYYNKDGSIWDLSTLSVDPYGVTAEGLQIHLDLMAKAFEQPVLEYNMEFAKPDDDEGLI
ncbi:MAG: hypothetical protein A4E65_02335 [Syntrophorhabdus sp. PtaU1.Bin153]|nr:MAG: hypothetical protein A4E65_02335 [Syntrophorhabdus sp. PtaU1.Bin153]